MIDHDKARQLAKEIYADITDRAVIKHNFIAIESDDKEVYEEIINKWADIITEWGSWLEGKRP
jgi:hypothetical protein